MKKTTIAALVVATAAVGFTVAYADQGDDKGFGGRHGRRGPSEAQLLEKFDANHNGVLDPEEKEAAKKEFGARREARRAEMLKKYDTDGDGKLSDSEREALRKDTREHHQERENR